MLTIIGAGKFGQAISKLLGKNEHRLVDVEKDGSYSQDTIKKIRESDELIFCVPSTNLPDCLKMLSPLIKKNAAILSCTKGIYDDLKTPTELIRSSLQNPVSALMGPNLAAEIMLGRPAMASIAGDFASNWAKKFASTVFKVIVEKDTVGIEFGAALKNISALGAGLIDGYYENNACNTIGSFIAYSLKETQELYTHKNKSALPMLSFIGDLFATCASEGSRNHQFGHQFGSALKNKQPLPSPEQTVEGYRTLQIVQKYSKEHKINLPTINALHEVFFKNGKVEDILGN